MGCSCKTGGKNVNNDVEQKINKSVILGYVKRFILFSLVLLFLPIMVIVITHILFKTIVLNQSLNIKEMLGGLTKVLKRANSNYDDDDDDDFYDLDDLTEDDVELEEVEDLTKE